MESNFTNKNKFKVIIHNEHGRQLEFFAKAVTFGGVQVGVTNIPTPVKNFKASGSTYSCDDLGIDFYIDEHWKVYIELLKWQKLIRNGNDIKSRNMYLNDISIEILDTKYKHSFFVDCKDCFPQNLGSVSLDEDDDISTVVCHIDFACNDYDIDEVK